MCKCVMIKTAMLKVLELVSESEGDLAIQIVCVCASWFQVLSPV